MMTLTRLYHACFHSTVHPARDGFKLTSNLRSSEDNEMPGIRWVLRRKIELESFSGGGGGENLRYVPRFEYGEMLHENDLNRVYRQICVR